MMHMVFALRCKIHKRDRASLSPGLWWNTGRLLKGLGVGAALIFNARLDGVVGEISRAPA